MSAPLRVARPQLRASPGLKGPWAGWALSPPLALCRQKLRQLPGEAMEAGGRWGQRPHRPWEPGAGNSGRSRQPPWSGPDSQGDRRQGRQQRRPKSQTHLAPLQRRPVRARTDDSEDRRLPKQRATPPLHPMTELKAGTRPGHTRGLVTISPWDLHPPLGAPPKPWTSVLFPLPSLTINSHLLQKPALTTPPRASPLRAWGLSPRLGQVLLHTVNVGCSLLLEGVSAPHVRAC